MQHFPRVFGVGLCAILLPVYVLQAETPATATPADAISQEGPYCLAPIATVVMEIYVLGKEDAQAMIESKHSSSDRYQRVLDLERAGRARLETLTALAAQSGVRAVIEARDDVRYPTEFTPGNSRGDIPNPTAFETRDVGDMLAIEPEIGPDGQHCSLTLVTNRLSRNYSKPFGIGCDFQDAGGQEGIALQLGMTPRSFS